MGRNRQIVRGMKTVLEQGTGRDIEMLRAALEANGMGINDFARLLACMIQGYRPALEIDKEQAAMVRRGEEHDRYMPSFVEVNGESCTRIDQKTQLNAMKLMSEILGWKSSGLNVNVNQNSGTQAIGGGGIALLDAGGAPTNVREVVNSLESNERRALLMGLLAEPSEVVEASGSSQVKEEADGTP